MNKTELDKIPTQRLVYCNRCKGDTRHENLWKSSRDEAEFSENESDRENQPPFIAKWIYIGWRCLGCDSVSLEERYTDDSLFGQDGQPIWIITFHPPRIMHQIRPKFFYNLPNKLVNIYKESLSAFNVSARLLCATGLRSLIEGICMDKHIDGKNLEQKIDGLSSILPANIVKNLHSLRFMGNFATHELEQPETSDIRLAIEICEDLLNYLYELDYKTARLEKNTNSNLKK